MGKHTAGPWIFERVNTWPFSVIVKSGEKVIYRENAACHSTQQKTREDCEQGVGFNEKQGVFSRENARQLIAEQDANAALISAAPDLLQLCERALALLSNPDADQFMADALEVELQIVINKAKGQ